MHGAFGSYLEKRTETELHMKQQRKHFMWRKADGRNFT